MPVSVDRDVQRAHVTDLGARLVANEGVGALTFRRVADAAGSSTAIVSTYFTDKRDLLVSTLRAAAARTTVRFEAAMAAGGGLQECLEAWLPLDAERRADWRVIIAYWGVAVADPALGEVQNGHVDRARGRVEALLRDRLGEQVDRPADRARQIVALMLGIALQAAFEPERPHARRAFPQRQLLADGLARLLARSTTEE